MSPGGYLPEYEFGSRGTFPCHCAGEDGLNQCNTSTGYCAMGCYTDSNIYGSPKLGNWKGPACQLGM